MSGRLLFVLIAVAVVSCQGLPTPVQPSEVQTDCDKFLAAFEGGHDAGLSCSEALLKAQLGAPKCNIPVVCHNKQVEVDSGLSE